MNSDSDSDSSDNAILPDLVPRNDDDDKDEYESTGIINNSMRMPPLEARNHLDNDDIDSDDNYDDTEEEDSHADMPPLERRPSTSGDDTDEDSDNDEEEGDDGGDDNENDNDNNNEEDASASPGNGDFPFRHYAVWPTLTDNDTIRHDNDDDNNNGDIDIDVNIDNIDSHWMDFITSRRDQTDEFMNEGLGRRLPPPESGLLSILSRALQSSTTPSSGAANVVSILTNGIRERWIQITMEQVEHPNRRSGGVSIWDEGSTGGGGSGSGGIIESVKECGVGVEELTNTLDGSRYCILRKKVLFQF